MSKDDIEAYSLAICRVEKMLDHIQSDDGRKAIDDVFELATVGLCARYGHDFSIISHGGHALHCARPCCKVGKVIK